VNRERTPRCVTGAEIRHYVYEESCKADGDCDEAQTEDTDETNCLAPPKLEVFDKKKGKRKD
jgi:hypothetical protein